MYVQDCFFKQGWSEINFPSVTKKVIVPQYTYNGNDFIPDEFKVNKYYEISFADKAGNYNSYGSWFKEVDDLYYYNKYEKSHNMPYPPYQ